MKALPVPTARERVFAAGSVTVTQELKDGVFQVPEILLGIPFESGTRGYLVFQGFDPARKFAREVARSADLAEVWDVDTGRTVEQAGAMKAGDLVRLTKIESAPNAEQPTALAEEYIAGQDNGDVSPPNKYWVAGRLMLAPKFGQSVGIFRTVRNGERVDGTMRTSIVRKIVSNLENEGLILTTLNSVYVLEPWDGVVTAEGGA